MERGLLSEREAGIKPAIYDELAPHFEHMRGEQGFKAIYEATEERLQLSGAPYSITPPSSIVSASQQPRLRLGSWLSSGYLNKISDLCRSKLRINNTIIDQ